ncbi:MAG: phage portal protein [Deltaproteobacteria bacterium]|nr:phage portal protein [Deltaproteobacteria bacterium]
MSFLARSLDRAIEAVSPQRGVDRAVARLRLGLAQALVERRGGGRTGGYRNWWPRVTTRGEETLSREALALRAKDLAANDGHAASTIRTLCLNVVGKGLTPQSQPKTEVLGISEAEAQAFARQAEWAFGLWAKEADASGRLSFAEIQRMDLRTAGVLGETLKLMVSREPGPGRPFSLAVQVLDPLRLRTPSDLVGDLAVRDGIRLGPGGEPLAYHLADPADWQLPTGLTSEHFQIFPPRRGHRWVCLHRILDGEAEQIRGLSPLNAAMGLIKRLDEYFDMELAGAISAANFAVHMDTGSDAREAEKMFRGFGNTDASALKSDPVYQLEPGQITYGPYRPHILASPRPNNSFPAFVKSLERRTAASQGLPHLLTSKDFSEVNYSSARAAYLEAWKLFAYLRAWEVEGACQPIWEMVLEEAVCLGLVQVPGGVDRFYENREAWCNAAWTGPGRGMLDPNKEMEAYEKGLNNNVLTLAQIHAELGGDWQDALKQRAREEDEMRRLGLTRVPSASSPSADDPPAEVSS